MQDFGFFDAKLLVFFKWAIFFYKKSRGVIKLKKSTANILLFVEE